MTPPKPLPTTNAPQEGFVLIVGLVILGLLTMLALSSMRDTTMQEKMAGASRDSGLAFQAAESALRDAENCIAGTTAGCAFNATNDAHFNEADAAFPAHNTLFNATTWATIDPPGNPTDLVGIPSKKKGDATDGANYIIRQARTISGAADGGGGDAGTGDYSRSCAFTM
ncbi:MAG: PilX N-terminal domain-containing pilus assembly protein [Arenicellales bacterium]|nr:PilX N-terminal domain-containing pilus assembly protein [Arenicellales bacterium]